MKPVVETRSVAELQPHPLNERVFGAFRNAGEDADLVQSVQAQGILQPLLVTADGTVISGHRRLAAARLAGLETVPVIVRDDLRDQIDIDRTWFECNQNRDMTKEQRARWYEQRVRIEQEEAKRRQEASQKGGTESKNVKISRLFRSGKIFPDGSDEDGRAKSRAAKEVGMSRPTAEKAAEVVAAIDQAEAAGDTETVANLRHLLEHKSVSAAHRHIKKPQQPEAEPAPDASVVLDDLSRPVPFHLREAHQRAGAILSISKKLGQALSDAEKIASLPGAQWLDISLLRERVHLAQSTLKSAVYWTACPQCNAKGCKRCRNSGFLGRSAKGQLTAEDKAALGVET